MRFPHLTHAHCGSATGPAAWLQAAVGLSLLLVLCGSPGPATARLAGRSAAVHRTAPTRAAIAAGRRLAQRAVLDLGALGPGYSAAPAPSGSPKLTCPAFHPSLPGVVKLATSVSPSFSGGDQGPFVAQTAYAFASRAEASAVWKRLVVARFVRCAEDGLRSGSTRRTALRPRSGRLVRGPEVGARSVIYRVFGSATSSQGESADVFLDLLVLARGTVLSTVAVTSLSTPIPASLERSLARAVARRLPRS